MAKKKKTETSTEPIHDSQTIADQLNKMDNGEDFVTAGTRERAQGRPQGKTLVSGASYHDFQKVPVYIGQYRRDVIREKDGQGPNEKKGDVIGFVFEDEFGGETIISNSYSIKKALETIGYPHDVTLWIEFQGKTMVKGKPFNRFHVQTVE